MVKEGVCFALSGGRGGGSEFRVIEEIYMLAYETLKVCWMTIVAIKKRSAICICEPSKRRRFCPGLYIGTVFYTRQRDNNHAYVGECSKRQSGARLCTSLIEEGLLKVPIGHIVCNHIFYPATQVAQ